MIDILSVDNMRRSDAATIASGTPGRELMMRAARGVFESVSWKPPVAIVCGSGNNAGDGYVLALLLYEAGIECTVFCVYDRFSEDGRYYYDKCVEQGIKCVDGSELAKSVSKRTVPFDTIVDCLLGTGFKGEVRPELKAVIDAINECDAFTVSVDINSGLNGNNGMADTCVRSDLTVSVGGFKPGHFLNMAKDVMADKVNIDIGIEPVDEPYHLLEEDDMRAVLGLRKNFSNKGTYGYAALIGGSTRYSGAIRLAYMANAAMRSGAGVVKVALPASIVHDVAPHILESTLFPLSCRSIGNGNDGDESGAMTEVVYVSEEVDELISNVKTVAFGMGIGTSEGAAAILEHLLEKYTGTLIIDADGLNLLAGIDPDSIKDRKCDIVLTPHVKEFSRLCGASVSEIQNDPIGLAREYAAANKVTLLLKGPSTVITDGDRVFITDRGCAGMATAGSGDVLSGILAAVCAFAAPNADTSMKDITLDAAAAAYINGAAGELAQKEFGSISMIASDTIAAIPKILV